MKNTLLLLVSALLCICLTGCRTSQSLTTEEAKSLDNPKDFLILHEGIEKYTLSEYEFSEGFLRGKVGPATFERKGYNIHVYIHSKSGLNLDNEINEYTLIDYKDIEKLDYSKMETGKTILAATGITFGVILIIGAISFFSTPWLSLSGL